jgi:hypothetical protein
VPRSGCEGCEELGSYLVGRVEGGKVIRVSIGPAGADFFRSFFTSFSASNSQLSSA